MVNGSIAGHRSRLQPFDDGKKSLHNSNKRLLSIRGICHEHYPVIAAASDGNAGNFAAAIRRPCGTSGWRHPPNKQPATHPLATPKPQCASLIFLWPSWAKQGFQNGWPQLPLSASTTNIFGIISWNSYCFKSELIKFDHFQTQFIIVFDKLLDIGRLTSE